MQGHGFFQKGFYFHVTVWLVVFVVFFPIYWMAKSAFSPIKELITTPPTLFPQEPTLEHFRTIASATNFVTYLFNSILVGVCVTILTIFASTLGAYGLTRFRYPLKTQYIYFILFAYMIPQILFALPLFVILAQIGLGDTLLGLVLAELSFTFPFAMWLLTSFFEGIPKELEECAFIDGANRWQVFVKIVFPLARPGVVAMSVFTFLTSWNIYTYPLIMIVSENKKTLPLGISLFFHAKAVDWGLVMASSFLVSLPTLVIFFFMQKYFIYGLGGALKG